MHNYIAFDLIIKESDCNLNCDYCLTGQSWFADEHLSQKIFSPPNIHSCLPGTLLFKQLCSIVNRVAEQDVPVIKVSGGEVMMIEGFIDFVEKELAPLFETVVVLTNGLLITPQLLPRLKSIDQLVLQVSLDSMNFFGNSYRIPSRGVFEKFINRLYHLLGSGIPIEIYAVLNDRSIEYLPETLEKLAPFAKSVSFYPFPVRGIFRDKYLPNDKQIVYIQWIVDNWDIYADLLPPKVYFEQLLTFLTEGKRTFRCHLPRIAFTAFDNGLASSCPNIWFNKVMNFHEQDSTQIFEALDQSTFKKLLLSERPKIDACKNCYTPWDMITLYFENKVSLDQLSRCPIYKGSRTLAKMERSKKIYSAACF